ncbi:hypothetical protein DL93DRAFT_2081221 [Clavulina sp. PMI_390]|nr:hypothetical protein DL93DRAFT_2081221 [Clavulina sp. PMI_390]
MALPLIYCPKWSPQTPASPRHSSLLVSSLLLFLLSPSNPVSQTFSSLHARQWDFAPRIRSARPRVSLPAMQKKKEGTLLSSQIGSRSTFHDELNLLTVVLIIIAL